MGFISACGGFSSGPFRILFKMCILSPIGSERQSDVELETVNTSYWKYSCKGSQLYMRHENRSYRIFHNEFFQREQACYRETLVEISIAPLYQNSII